MKTQTRAVVIGGGIAGCSALYHLTKLGWTDVVLVERDELTSGSTWHAAGNCPTFATSWNVIKYHRYSNQLYARLAEEVDYPINYHITGSVRLAHSKARMDEFKHITGMARHQGLEFELLSPAEIRERHPFAELHDLEGGLWDPYDGDIDPSQATQAFAKGARDLGAEIYRFTKVTGLEQLPDDSWKVITDKGEIHAEVVVNAGGYRGGEVGEMVGQYLPIVSMSHQFLITEPIPELEARKTPIPLLRDPDDSYYLRQERGGLILGPYEWQATPHWLEGLPENFAYQLYPDDLERLEWYIESACARVPILGSVGVQKVINGPIPYTPDGLPLIGPARGLRNFFQCCSFSFGISQGGGAGKTVAEYIVHGEPEWDMWPLDPRRYTDYATKTYVTARAIELYQNEYAIIHPVQEWPAGRPAKTTPLYEKFKAKGAMFGARGGWERATWFPRNVEDAREAPSFRRAHWFDTVGEECRAVREKVGILDLGGFSKFRVSGPGAEAWLDGVICGRLPGLGRVTLAYALNHSGGIVSEFTITRLGDDQFLLIGAAAALWHDEDWLRANLPSDGSVGLEDQSARYGTLVVAGPRARDVLAAVTETNLSNNAFPWLTAQEIEIAMARMLALRVNYVGELGWELHVPVEYMVQVYDRLWEAGAAHDIVDFGAYAMESLRLEKCYRAWKVDLTHEYTPAMAGLERFVALDKGSFVGCEALLKEREAGPAEIFVPLLVDAGDADAPPCASVFKHGEIVGLVTSGGYGHAIGQSIALAYMRPDLAVPGTEVEVGILGERVTARVAAEPLLDPKNEKLRG